MYRVDSIYGNEAPPKADTKMYEVKSVYKDTAGAVHSSNCRLENHDLGRHSIDKTETTKAYRVRRKVRNCAMSTTGSLDNSESKR